MIIKSKFLPLIILLLAYLVLAAAYAVRTPAWLSPDEPAHYNYIAQVASTGCCPTIQPGDWDQAYLAELTGSDFAPASLDRFDTIQYEDHQPPLYYLLGSLVFRLTDGSLTALRLFSVMIGAGVVATAFFVARAMLPRRPDVALGTAGVVAFIPQHLHILASVNNDGLAELLVGLTLWMLIVYIKQDRRSPRVTPWMLGILVGVGLLTKVSTIFMAGLVPLFIVLRLWLDSRTALQSTPAPADTQSPTVSVGTRHASSASSSNAPLSFSEMFIKTARHVLPRAVLCLTLFAIPMLLLAGVWWIRNFGVYGFPDFLGLRAHDAVVVGQPRTADLIAEIGFPAYLRRAAEITFHSFWGQFGWMETALPTWAYLLIGALLALSLLGWMLYAFTRLRPASRLSAALTFFSTADPHHSPGEPTAAHPSPDAPPTSSASTQGRRDAILGVRVPLTDDARSHNLAVPTPSTPTPQSPVGITPAPSTDSSLPTPARTDAILGVHTPPPTIPASSDPSPSPTPDPVTPPVSSSPSLASPTPDPVTPPVSSSPSLASPPPDPVAAGHPYSQSLAWALLLLTAILAVAQFIYYNTEFQQFQGRYTYPGLIPFALIFTLGITTLAQPIIRRIPLRVAILSYLALLALLLPLLTIVLYALWRLLPSLSS